MHTLVSLECVVSVSECAHTLPGVTATALKESKGKSSMGKSENRARQKIIMVRVSEEEYGVIKKNAESCDLSMPELLRSLGKGYQPKSTLDAQHILELAKLNGDLGRLGGLLKLWLSSSEKKGFGNHLNVPETLKEINDIKLLIAEKVKAL